VAFLRHLSCIFRARVRDLEQRLAEALRDKSEALEQQTATAEILRVISSSPTDVQPVFSAILANALRLCGADQGGVFTFDGHAFRVAAISGKVTPEFCEALASEPIPPGRETPLRRVALERRAIQVADIQNDPGYSPPTIYRAEGMRTTMAVPLLKEGELIGALAFHRREVRPFTEQQISMVETFADQAVIAIENARLFTELQASNRELTTALDTQTATSDILGVISRSQADVQPVFEAIAENAARLVQAWSVTVLRWDGESIHLAAERGGPPGSAQRLRDESPWLPNTTSGPGRCIATGTVIHVPDVDLEPEDDTATRELAHGRGWRSNLCVPMLRDGSPIGAISVTRVEAGPFSPGAIELLETFADQAVIAIENARLLSELQASNRELTQALDREAATGEILRVINTSPTTADPVFDAILERGMRLCRADVGLLVLTEEDMFRLVAQRGAPAAFVEPRRRAFHSGPHTGLTRAVQERRPVHIEDLTADVAYIEGDATRLQTLQILGARTGVWVPLLREAEPVGVLVTWRREVRPFTAAEIDILTTFANQAVIALENVRLLRELKDKSQQLEAASQHKSEFLANMSHELRTPLNAIIGFSEVLGERLFGELNEKQEEYLKDIHASGQHLLSLINDILDLSKIEAGRMELELTDFDLPTAIDNALTLVRERASRRGIGLHQATHEGLGQIRADERKIKQVLLNLLSNAIKFTPDGGRIDVRARPVDGSVEISVSDTGVGIAPEDQEAIFEEFRQVGTADKKVEGTGLGLALSRKFIELHGGRIWVQSQVGMGSTFTFTIPMRIGT
jgi:two-component system, NtrC family, sensor kinase